MHNYSKSKGNAYSKGEGNVFAGKGIEVRQISYFGTNVNSLSY